MAIHTLSAVELLERMAKRDLSAVEIVRALHARADAVNGSINGWAHQLREDALIRAEAADAADDPGPLNGLPISVKENIATAGLPVTMGLRYRQSTPEPEDAVTVRLAREAGAIVMGKGNVPQMLLAMESENPIWGTTNNPWMVGRTSGGSSGGGAALVASGQVPLAIVTDASGSIRQPASFCGIVGLKPMEHRWSGVGITSAIKGQEGFQFSTGVLARTTADITLMMRTLDSPLHTPHDPFVPPVSMGDPTQIDLRGLRIGYYEDDGFFTPSVAIQRAIREAAEHLRDAGAALVPYAPPNVEAIAMTAIGILSADGTTTLTALLRNEPLSPQLTPLFRIARLPATVRKAAAGVMAARGELRVAGLLRALGRKPVEELWRLTAARTRFRREEQAAWDAAGIHAVLCAPHVTPAVRQRESGDFSLSSVYGMRYNLLNLPAGTVPVTRVREDEQRARSGGDRFEKKAAMMDEGSAGLPACVQVVGRAWREDVVLAVMAAIEARARGGSEYPHTPVNP